MILLVFEGQNDEPKIMATVKALFFSGGKEQLLCSYGTDTYTLWKEVQEHIKDGYEADVFQIVKARMHSRGDYSLDSYNSYDIEAIYLFFDYDPQNDKVGLLRINQAISSVISTFNDAMDQGQIFISYPMVEALYCENCIPDQDYFSATTTLADCHDFKRWSKSYQVSQHREDIKFNANKLGEIIEDYSQERYADLRLKWNELVKMNASKANLICNNSPNIPNDVSLIPQSLIFQHEISDYVLKNNVVSILSSFPLFLFEYFHGNGDF